MLPLSTWVASGLLSLASLANAQSAGDYFVHELPGAPAGDTTKMHAGHIEINPDTHANLFFWHVQNKHIANRQRTVIWLNGGPGCSSEDGVLMEIGPYRLKDENTLTYNNGSWHEFANLLFVDNPVGTGYSFADTNAYTHELDEMASQFIIFLERFFALFPEYEHDDIYIAGESYAGQHIPYIAKAILDRNKQPGAPSHWNLGGLLIGNGWISPKDQYEAYLPFAYEKGVVTKGSEVGSQLEAQYRICTKDLATQADSVDIKACEAVLQDILRLRQDTHAPEDSQCVNMYDVRKKDSYPSCGMNWPPDLAYVTPYLRKPEVTAALHVSDQKNTGWQECNGAVGHEFRTRSSKPSYGLLPDILKETSILLFSGGEDLICNYKGTESLISNMEWNGGKGFETAPSNWAARRDWTFEGDAAGFWQEARNLTYVHFYNASHMVPFDYARRSRDMLDRFMKVDINSIGGAPSQSMLDGQSFSDTTVGGAKQDAATGADQIDEAKWDAYQRSGEVVLTLVAIAAAAWGVYIWRSRRHTKGYTGLPLNGDMSMSSLHTRDTGLDGFRNKRSGHDVEAGDFDEGELDDLHVTSPTDMEHDHYSIGDDSDNDDAAPAAKQGQSSRR